MNRLALAALAALVGAGCGADPQPPPVIAAHAPPGHPAVVEHRRIWAGVYECAQGETAVRLTIDDFDNHRLHAKFEFGPLHDNPNVPRGVYTLIGSRTEDRGQHTVVLRPERWLVQPAGYVMVGVLLHDEGDPAVMRGEIIDGPGCGAIRVHRAD